MKKLVSIVVPVYNCEKYVKRCIDSILTQTYTNLEVIIIDDGSVDNSPFICDEIAKEDKRVHVFHVKNGGVSKARNLGLDKAGGDYILFVDADDTIHPEMIKKMLDKICDNDCVFCKYIKIGEIPVYVNEFNIAHLNDKDRLKYFIGNKNKLKKNMLYKHSIMGSVWRVLFTKKLLNGVRFKEDLKYSEDFVFIMEMLNKKPKIAVLDEYLYNYYDNDISFTSSINLKKIDYYFQILNYIYKYFDNKNYYKQLAYFEVATIINIYFILKSNNKSFTDLDSQKKAFVKQNLTLKKIRYFCKFESSLKLKILAYLIKFKIKK